jgi:hypothetical protein
MEGWTGVQVDGKGIIIIVNFRGIIFFWLLCGPHHAHRHLLRSYLCIMLMLMLMTMMMMVVVWLHTSVCHIEQKVSSRTPIEIMWVDGVILDFV